MIEHDGKGVVILAPIKADIRSYHSSGKSSKEEYLAEKAKREAHFECIKHEFRL